LVEAGQRGIQQRELMQKMQKKEEIEKQSQKINPNPRVQALLEERRKIELRGKPRQLVVEPKMKAESNPPAPQARVRLPDASTMPGYKPRTSNNKRKQSDGAKKISGKKRTKPENSANKRQNTKNDPQKKKIRKSGGTKKKIKKKKKKKTRGGRKKNKRKTRKRRKKKKRRKTRK